MTMPSRFLLAAVLATLFGCGSGKEAEPPPPSAEVTTVAADVREIRGTVAGYGSVEFDPARAEALVVQVESQVVEVLVAAGAAVRRGDGLVRLRASAATQLEVDKAVREASAAAVEQAREARLRDAGLATESEAAAAASAAGTANQLRDSLMARTGGGREYVLKTPRDGVVDTLTAQPGDVIATGAIVTRIGDARALQARIGLEPNDASRVRAGAIASVGLLGGSGHRIEGKVVAVQRRIDKDTGLAAALVSLPEGGDLIPGVPVGGKIVVSTRPAAIVVPRAALIYDGPDAAVFVVEASHARRRVVHVGVVDDEGVEILDGLKQGEHVVTVGNHELEDGMAVRAPAPPAPAEDAGKPSGEDSAKKAST
jgi:RND family efflux transporter MFP subunit